MPCSCHMETAAAATNTRWGGDLLIVGVVATEMACAGTTEVMFVCPCDHVCEGSLWYSPSLLGS